jgi:N-glycosylase/DNA lyase
MKLVKISAPAFDLAKTLDSGQVFHWEKLGDGFVGTIGDRAVYVEQCGNVLQVRASEGELDCLKQSSCDGTRLDGRMVSRTVAHYFALDHPLAEICASFPNDRIMIAARNFCRGLRIIRQPKWECLATFICSSMKQVAHIRQISLALRERFGVARKACPERGRKIDNYVVNTFPSAARLAKSSERELRKCALGYRAKNLLATAQLVSSGATDLEASSALSDVDLRKKLCRLPGVGAKIANCVMLFAYERLRAFPIDVWIERVLREKYFPRTKKVTAQRLREFCETYFGEHGGYAQQYLFHHARIASRNAGAPRDFSTPLCSGRNDKRRDARTALRKSGVQRDSSTALCSGGGDKRRMRE